MLQAQIDIVDEAGHTEESVTIVGSGQVSLGTRQAGGYLHANEAEPDFAVIAKDGDRLWIEVKQPNALRRDTGFLATGSLEVASSSDATLAFIAELQRYLKIARVVVRGELLSGSAVIHTAPSSLLRRARTSAARGMLEVSEQLERLRAQGKIDDQGNILVPWPDDMKPDSQTDL